MRVSKKQNAYNRAVKSSLKTAHKKFLAAPAEEAEAAYRKASSELALAARKGVIPKQRADLPATGADEPGTSARRRSRTAATSSGPMFSK
jgi:hypothetical protein